MPCRTGTFAYPTPPTSGISRKIEAYETVRRHSCEFAVNPWRNPDPY